MFKKYEKNPVIRPIDVKPSTEGYQVVGAFNPGAAIFNREVILLVRVAEKCIQEQGKIRVPIYRFSGKLGFPEIMEFDANDPEVRLKDTRGVYYKGKDYLSSVSHLRIARSRDGINFTIDDNSFIFPCSQSEAYGIEDARIVLIDDTYYINYTIVSPDSWCTKLSSTKDFKNLTDLGIIFHPENKDVAIFPEKINDKYIAFHRPNNTGFGNASIWYAESPDLLHWGNHKCIIRSKDNELKIGGGSAPVKTKEGWLTFYHAKDADSRYSLFGLLLDLDDPGKEIRRSSKPLLEPEFEYETSGFFGNVVFTNGLVIKDDKIFLYYGASDETCCLATASIEEILSAF